MFRQSSSIGMRTLRPPSGEAGLDFKSQGIRRQGGRDILFHGFRGERERVGLAVSMGLEERGRDLQFDGSRGGRAGLSVPWV